MAEADPKIHVKASAALMPAFAVRLDAFLRVKPFISTEETRYYLQGVYVDVCAEGGAVCTATDGHRLGMRRDAEGIVFQPTIVTVPKELKMPPKSLLFATPWLVCFSNGSKGHISLVEANMERDEDTAQSAIDRVEDCTIRFGSAVIDGTFPDVKKVIPDKGDRDSFGFNGEYVKSFGKSLNITRGATSSDPVLVQDDADPEFLGVLMPLRVTDRKIPSWVRVSA